MIRFGEEGKKDTQEAFDDPRPGDRFSEMAAFYVYVIDVEEDRVLIIEANPPCTFPKDGKWSVMTKDEFRARFAYGTIPGYWVRLIDRGNEYVREWEPPKSVEWPGDSVDKYFLPTDYAAAVEAS